MLNAAPASADDSGDYTALVLGHALLSQPDAAYMKEVIDTYVDNPINFGQPMYHIVGDPVSVYTPETDYMSGLTQGVTDLTTRSRAADAILAANPRREHRRRRLLDEQLGRHAGDDQSRESMVSQTPRG